MGEWGIENGRRADQIIEKPRIYTPMSPRGSQPRSTLSAPLRGRRLEAQLAHGGHQVGFLDRLREVRGKHVPVLRRLDSAVRADGDNGRRRVLVVGTFDIPSGTFTIH